MYTEPLQFNSPRKGCHDVWNAFMCRGAQYGPNDIPFCPTTATCIPAEMITWDEAKAIYKRAIRKGDTDFTYDAFVCWYIDDYKFDGERGIWKNYEFALTVLRHFSGAITPDFSTFQDFPEPLKIYNTFRMRAFGFWLGMNGIPVINNCRWGTSETFRYCYEGIPRRSMVAIGTVGGSPRRLQDRERFENGLRELIHIVNPEIIIVYGSANYPCFDWVRSLGITVVEYPSQTALAFSRRRSAS